jgi:hypothetical protein
MSIDGFNMSELEDFASDLIGLAQEKVPKEVNKFMRKEGTKLRKLTLKKAKSAVKKDTGNYFKGIKRGRVYLYEGDQKSIRVYGASPHSHLIEYGHRQITKSGQETGFVKGHRVFEKSAKEFEDEYFDDVEDFIDDLLDKGLR